MVYRWLFPKQGGGWVKRYLEYRKEITKKSFEAIQKGDHLPCTPLTIFDFRRHDDAVDAYKIQQKAVSDAWRLSDDRVIGGFSESSATLLRSQSDYTRYIAGDLEEMKQEQESSAERQFHAIHSMGRISGHNGGSTE
jgi:hypothetical protein